MAKLFLVNPKNADFVRGNAPAPADGGAASSMLGYVIFALLVVVALSLGGASWVQW
jgi:hypothetical protein